jgi:hypothetical protein
MSDVKWNPKNKLSPQEVADYWGVSVKTLAKWRSLNQSPIYKKVGRKVWYSKEWIEEYETEHLYKGTGERIFSIKEADDEQQK